MNKWLSVFLILLVGALEAVLAQDAASIPPPTKPLLRRLPKASEWTVTIWRDRDKAKAEFSKPSKHDEEAEEELPQSASTMIEPLQTTITKYGDLIREKTVWSNKKVTEKWISGTFQLREGEQTDDIYRVMTPRSFYSPDYSDYSNSDFEECEWIRMENYKGIQKINGKAVYVFDAGANEKALTNREKADKALLERDGAADAPVPSSRRHVVYLDVEKQVPVFADDGSEILTYTYARESPAPLTLPPRFASALSEWKAEIAQRTRVPTPP